LDQGYLPPPSNLVEEYLPPASRARASRVRNRFARKQNHSANLNRIGNQKSNRNRSSPGGRNKSSGGGRSSRAKSPNPKPQGTNWDTLFAAGVIRNKSRGKLRTG